MYRRQRRRNKPCDRHRDLWYSCDIHVRCEARTHEYRNDDVHDYGKFAESLVPDELCSETNLFLNEFVCAGSGEYFATDLPLAYPASRRRGMLPPATNPRHLSPMAKPRR